MKPRAFDTSPLYDFRNRRKIRVDDQLRRNAESGSPQNAMGIAAAGSVAGG